ncbi:tagaturonate reductase [Mucilaginibacter calamicampi]|uniref:Tagaturonate reductase n=1 Tax=Mucilaginibacter calamicampi TaxID=1302352 RepID=A0ABW2Z0A9_9SPHI
MIDVKPINLSNKTIGDINAPGVITPSINYLNLPVKVLQFGTGVLLRGLTDHIIDKANKAGIFNGRIAVVKSTSTGGTDAFAEQNNLYTLQMKGIENKQLTEETVINTAIARVLSAADEWNLVLKEAENPELKVVISNTTEVGLQLVEENIDQQPPSSFPAKLLAVLNHRYKSLNGSAESGLVIIPTELLPDNAIILKSIIKKLIAFNGLSADFEKWLDESNYFCNSLVDRIVTGKPSLEEQKQFEQKNGYHDALLIVSEPYCLWAIEGDDKVKEILSFEQADPGAVVIPDIEVHRELKLRLLNGTHTLSCALALCMGFDLVNTATNNAQFSAFLEDLMKEIYEAMPYKPEAKLAAEFSERVLDRFRNPFIQHQWVAIAQQYTTKIITRVLPVLKEHYRLFNNAPENIARGLAAYMFLMSKVVKDNKEYYLTYKNERHLLKDDKIGILVEKWAVNPASVMASEILGAKEIWGEDLSQLPGLAHSVQNKLNDIVKNAQPHKQKEN